MARGIYQFNDTITTDTDTALVAAPGAGQRINVRWITIDVQVANASGLILIEDGVGGDVIATVDAADDNNRIERVFHVEGASRGRQLTENTALNAQSSDIGTVVINGEVEVT